MGPFAAPDKATQYAFLRDDILCHANEEALLRKQRRQHAASLGRKLFGAGLVLALATLAAKVPPARAAGSAVDEATLELYKTKCQPCHLADGNSPIKEMNFADGEWIHGSKLTDVVKVIEEGVPGKAMLPFKEKLTKEEIEGLAKYVRTFDKKLAVEKGAKGGK
jgi:mono/diheme cytochrome c family protein